MKVSFVLPGEPASKANRRQFVLMGRDKIPASIKSEKARDYEHNALLCLHPDHRKMFQGPVKVTMRIFYRSNQSDLDETLILDILQARFSGKGKDRKLSRRGVYLNDRQVKEKHIYHHLDKANPRAEIEVEELEPSLELTMPAPKPASGFDAVTSPVKKSRERSFENSNLDDVLPF